MANFSERARLLKQRCIACGKPVVEAQSVEAGMGPVCRKRYAWEGLPADSRELLNNVLTELSFDPTIDNVCRAIGTAQRVGADRLEKLLIARFVDVEVVETNDKFYTIRFDYHEGMILRLRKAPGAFFNRKQKVWWVPQVNRHFLWVAICENYPGRLCKSAKGITRIPEHVDTVANPNHRIGRRASSVAHSN